VRDRATVTIVLISNIKWHKPFQLTQKSLTKMTVNDYYALRSVNHVLFGAHQGELKEDKPILSVAKWTLLLAGIRFIRFVGYRGKRLQMIDSKVLKIGIFSRYLPNL